MAKEELVYEANTEKFIAKLSEELKKFPEFEMPEWAMFVKTSVARERPPIEMDWWYKRTASILRQIYIRKVIGVQRLRTRYGGKKDRGMKPEKFERGSGKIIRVILQQSEKAGLLEKAKGKKVGRKLTDKGRNFLDKIAKSLL